MVLPTYMAAKSCSGNVLAAAIDAFNTVRSVLINVDVIPSISSLMTNGDTTANVELRVSTAKQFNHGNLFSLLKKNGMKYFLILPSETLALGL